MNSNFYETYEKYMKSPMDAFNNMMKGSNPYMGNVMKMATRASEAVKNVQNTVLENAQALAKSKTDMATRVANKMAESIKQSMSNVDMSSPEKMMSWKPTLNSSKEMVGAMANEVMDIVDMVTQSTKEIFMVATNEMVESFAEYETGCGSTANCGSGNKKKSS